ncbi:MAG TPA: hypothetical protein VFD98_08075 [Terracidiphilus sp.]|jgi:hypothetical protein|nr:hypothetical protein [Terracidiphilus sp.]
MILQTVELSPNQKAAIEETLGRKLQDRENIVLCGNKLRVASVADRENAAQKMRYQLALLDQSQRRMSIEDCVAALLEKSEATLPA